MNAIYTPAKSASPVRMSSKRLSVLGLLCEVQKHTLYERNGYWCVHFCHDNKQRRIATGKRSREEAQAFVESFMALSPQPPQHKEVMDEKQVGRMLKRCHSRARKRKLAFNLRIQDVRDLASRSGGRCEVTGIQLRPSGPFKPSIDRIECSKGYVRGNLRIACLVANTAMLNYGEGVLLQMATSMCKKHGVFAQKNLESVHFAAHAHA